MSNALTISAPSGRIWLRPPGSGERGQLLSVDFSISAHLPAEATGVSMSLSGETLFTIDTRGNITSFLLSQNRYTQPVRVGGHCSKIVAVPGDFKIAAGLRSKAIEVYNLEGKKTHSFHEHASEILGFSLNVRKNWLLSVSKDKAVIWDWETWRKVREMATRGVGYHAVKFTPDGQSLVTCFNDGKLYMWSLGTNALEKTFAMSDTKLFCISDDGTWIFGSKKDGSIQAWRTDYPNKLQYTLPAVPGVREIKQLEYYPNKLVYVADNGRLYMVSLDNFAVTVELGAKFYTSFSIAADKMSCVLNNGAVELYHIDSLVRAFKATADKKASMGMLPDEIYTMLAPIYNNIVCNGPVDDPLPMLDSKEDIVFAKIGAEKSISSASSSCKDLNCQHELFKNMFEKAKIKPCDSKIQHCYLRRLLHTQGQYPEKYRPLIWRFLLQLPNNRDSFAGFSSKGTHPQLAHLFEKLPAQPHSLFARTEKVCSALAYWSPVFGEVDYLGELVYPFAKVFEGDELSLFETIMSLVMHWLQHWFEFFPNPPVVVLQSVENLLKENDPKLVGHIQRLTKGESLGIYWHLLRTTLFSVMNFEDWVKFVDFIITDWDKPELLIYTVACYLLYHKHRILKFNKEKELRAFINKKRPTKVSKFINSVFDLYDNTGNSVVVVGFAQKLPVTQGAYPLFTGYPKFKVVRKDEEELPVKDDTHEKIQEMTKNLEQKEREFKMRIQNTYDAEQAKLNFMKKEQQARLEALKGFDDSIRAQKARQIRELEAENQAFVQDHQRQREQIMSQIQKDIGGAGDLRNYVQQTLKENEAINALEYSTTNKLLQMLNDRCKQEQSDKAALLDMHWEQELRIKDEQKKKEWSQENERREIEALSAKFRADQEKEYQTFQSEILKNQADKHMKELERETRILQIQKERKMRELSEDELSRNNEFSTLINQKKEQLKMQERMQIESLKETELAHEKQREEERLEKVTFELKKNMNEEIAKRRKELEEENQQYERELEVKLATLRKEYQQKTIDQEKKFEEEVLKLEEKRRTQRRLEQELDFKHQELQEKNAFEKVLRETEKRQESDRGKWQEKSEEIEELKELKELKANKEREIRMQNEIARKKLVESKLSSSRNSEQESYSQASVTDEEVSVSHSSRNASQMSRGDSPSVCSTCGEVLEEEEDSECSCSEYSSRYSNQSLSFSQSENNSN